MDSKSAVLSPPDSRTAPMVDNFIIRQVSKAELLVGLGQTDEAVATLKEVLRLNPDSTHAQMKLKDIYLRADKRTEAAEVCLQLARIHSSQGDAASSKDYIARAHMLAPSLGPLEDLAPTSAPPATQVSPIAPHPAAPAASEDRIARSQIEQRLGTSGSGNHARNSETPGPVERTGLRPEPTAALKNTVIREVPVERNMPAPTVRDSAPVVRQMPVERNTPPPTVRDSPPVVRQMPVERNTPAPTVRDSAPVVRQMPVERNTPAPTVQDSAPVVRQMPVERNNPAPTLRDSAPVRETPAPRTTPAPTVRDSQPVVRRMPDVQSGSAHLDDVSSTVRLDQAASTPQSDLAGIRQALMTDARPAPSVQRQIQQNTPQAIEHELPDDLETASDSGALVDRVVQRAPLAKTVAVPNLIASVPVKSRRARVLSYVAAALVICIGGGVAGMFWYEARLDRDYVALNQQFEAAAAANATALAQAEVVDAVQSEEVAVETPVEATEENPEATPDDIQAKKRERERLERERLDRERLQRSAQPSIQPSPSIPEQTAPASATVASLRTETRERRAAPPMTSQVPVNLGTQPVADNRSSGMLSSGTAGAPPPPPAAPAGKVVVAAEATSRFQPTFPRAASMAGISGTVGVMVTINEQGNVVEARAMSGPPLLKDAAVSAARKWKFKPSTIGGSPVKTTKTIVFNFKGDK